MVVSINAFLSRGRVVGVVQLERNVSTFDAEVVMRRNWQQENIELIDNQRFAVERYVDCLSSLLSDGKITTHAFSMKESYDG